MRKPSRLIALAAGAALIAGMAAPAMAAPPQGHAENGPAANDSPKSPLAAKQANGHAKALEKVLTGKATPAGRNKVVRVAKGQYVELARVGEDSIWSVLAEFGDQVNPSYGGTSGPQRNQIPEPDRTVDNSTIWEADFTSE
jgi:immune inhibitor A